MNIKSIKHQHVSMLHLSSTLQFSMLQGYHLLISTKHSTAMADHKPKVLDK